MTLIPSPSQTVGPFVEIGCTYLATNRLSANADVTVRGRVIDGDGEIVPDYMLEIWQPTASGPAAFGRVMPSADGSFTFRVKIDAPTHGAAPHLAVLVFMRGLLKPVLTRMYFPDNSANRDDTVLSLVPLERRSTLVAAAASDGSLEWNVRLQGANETVFFEW